MDISSLSLHNAASLQGAMLQYGSFHGGMPSSQDFSEILRRASSAADTAETRPGQGRTDIDRNSELFQLCLELETFLVKNLLSSMRNTVQKSGLIEDSFAGKMYEDMLWDEKAKDFTRNANFGLAEMAYRQLRRL